MQNFFSLSYWFSLHPGAGYAYYGATLLVAGLIFLTGTILYFLCRYKKVNPVTRRYLRGWPKHLFTISALTALWTLFRYENVYYLSARFWLVVLVAYFVWSLVVYLRKFKNYTFDQNVIAERALRAQYSPKKNAKKKR